MPRPIDPHQHHQPIRSSDPHHIKNELKSFNLRALKDSLSKVQGQLRDMLAVCIKDGQFDYNKCSQVINNLSSAIEVLKNEKDRPVSKEGQATYDKIIEDLENSLFWMRGIKHQINIGGDVKGALKKATEVCNNLKEITLLRIDTLLHP